MVCRMVRVCPRRIRQELLTCCPEAVERHGAAAIAAVTTVGAVGAVGAMGAVNAVNTVDAVDAVDAIVRTMCTTTTAATAAAAAAVDDCCCATVRAIVVWRGSKHLWVRRGAVTRVVGVVRVQTKMLLRVCCRCCLRRCLYRLSAPLFAKQRTFVSYSRTQTSAQLRIRCMDGKRLRQWLRDRHPPGQRRRL